MTYDQKPWTEADANRVYPVAKAPETAMTVGQIRWAMAHDWAIIPTLCGKGIICRDYDSVLCSNGEWHHDPIEVTFFDYRSLRAWAGY